MQLLALLITLALSSLGGLACGFLLSLGPICDPLDDRSLFDDDLFFNLPNTPLTEDEIGEGDNEDKDAVDHRGMARVKKKFTYYERCARNVNCGRGWHLGHAVEYLLKFLSFCAVLPSQSLLLLP